jgi:hypothetical protein
MVVLLVASFIIGWLVGAKQEQKRLSKYGTIGTKPKTQTDYQSEHMLETENQIEKGDINFMYNWIREKSGKNVKDTKSTPH